MRTIEKTIYKFSELSESAKEKAIADAQNANGYAWSHEAKSSIKKLAEHFGGKVLDWQIDYFDCSPSSMEFRMPDLQDDFLNYESDGTPEHDAQWKEWAKKVIENKLAALGSFNPETLKGKGDCVLTGYCADEDAIDGFRIAFNEGELNLEKLMQAAFESWLEACQADCADYYSEAQFSEHCDSNEYEFYENGELY